MSDYKYEIQQAAEELAWSRFEKDFYDLSSKRQDELYQEAERNYRERRA